VIPCALVVAALLLAGACGDDSTGSADAGADGSTGDASLLPDSSTEPDAALPELMLPAYDLASVEADLDFLCSPALTGRATATPGNELALAFVEQRFYDIGLEPAGDTPGSYRQEFPYTKFEQLSVPVVTLDGSTLVSGDDFTVVMYSSPGTVDASVVFVGYGLVVPPFDAAQYPNCPLDPAGFDELAGVNLTGKIVIYAIGVPDDDPNMGYCPFDYSGDRVALALDRGAAAVVGFFGYAYPPEAIRGFLASVSNGTYGMPNLALNRDTLERFLPLLPDWMADIDNTYTPQGRELALRATIRVEAQNVQTVSHNLLGLIPGLDPSLAHETVIVSGHIDHVGADEETGAVYCGANDNASGTVAAYHLAEQLITLYGQPRRSVLVAAWNGEETGLWGSTHYAANPLRDLLYTVGVVNIEMLSSGDGDSVLAYGENDVAVTWLIDLLSAAIWDLALPVEVIPIPMGRDSDHWPFYASGVPATSLRGGPAARAPYYHTPEDNMDNFVMDHMNKGMQASWALLLPLALGLEMEMLAPAPPPAPLPHSQPSTVPWPVSVTLPYAYPHRPLPHK